MNHIIEGLKALVRSFSVEQRKIIKDAVVAAYNAHVNLPSFLKGMGPPRIEKSIDDFLNNV